MYVGHFKCWSCSLEWHVKFTEPYWAPTECPATKCKEIYCTWLNFPIEKEDRCNFCETGEMTEDAKAVQKYKEEVRGG